MLLCLGICPYQLQPADHSVRTLTTALGLVSYWTAVLLILMRRMQGT